MVIDAESWTRSCPAACRSLLQRPGLPLAVLENGLDDIVAAAAAHHRLTEVVVGAPLVVPTACGEQALLVALAGSDAGGDVELQIAVLVTAETFDLVIGRSSCAGCRGAAPRDLARMIEAVELGGRPRPLVHAIPAGWRPAPKAGGTEWQAPDGRRLLVFPAASASEGAGELADRLLAEQAASARETFAHHQLHTVTGLSGEWRQAAVAEGHVVAVVLEDLNHLYPFVLRVPRGLETLAFEELAEVLDSVRPLPRPRAVVRVVAEVCEHWAA